MFLASGFGGRVSCLVSNELAAHWEILMDVVSPASDSLELDLGVNVELLCAAERGGRVSTPNLESSETLFHMLLVPGNG